MTISPRIRIVLVLCSLLVSVLLGAMVLRIVPDRREAVIEGRARLCEAMAVNSSILVQRGDIQRIQAITTVLVRRHDDIVSAGIRRSDDKLVVDVGNHAAGWKTVAGEFSDESQIYVPLQNAEGPWGSLEVRFAPLSSGIFEGFLQSPWVRLIAFVTVVSGCLWYLFLGRILEQLNPSRAIPGRVRETLDTLAEGLLAIDHKGRIALCNLAFARTLGEEPDNLVGRSVDSLPWENGSQPGDDSSVFPWFTILSGDETLSHATLQLKAADGTLRTYQANCAPVLGKESRVRGVFCCFEDVTELEGQKLELAESRASADAANRAKSAFLANMSHEIRTPMNAILGFTDILRREMYDDEQQRMEYLETVHSSGQHLLRLINDILDLSKVEAGRLEVEAISCSPHQILSELVNVMRGRADEKGLRLSCETPDGLPEIIETDPGRLRQIITNLVGNAIKFTERGGVTIVATMHYSSKMQLTIDVTDTGVGISEDAQRRIFDPFSQADGSITRRFGGTGLGLTISRDFALALGGNLTVTSVEGQGSTFRLTINPGEFDPDVRILDLSDFTTASTMADPDSHAGRYDINDSRILLVDDGEANRRLIRLILERNGARVEIATNGQEALDILKSAEFELVLMDMQMPIMDGYTATRLLRQKGLKLPIVALTANAMRGDEEKCLAAGCSGFLPKPVEMDVLLKVVSEQLSRGSENGCVEDPGYDPKLDVSTSSFDQKGKEADLLQTGASDFESLRRRKPEPTEGTELDAALSQLQSELSQAISDRNVSSSETPGEQTAGTGTSTELSERIVSTLPMDDPEFREIVGGFVIKLESEVERMKSLAAEGDFVELGKIAHWLKGAAGTVGFREFTEPSIELMTFVRDGRVADSRRSLQQIVELTQRVVIPEPV